MAASRQTEILDQLKEINESLKNFKSDKEKSDKDADLSKTLKSLGFENVGKDDIIGNLKNIKTGGSLLKNKTTPGGASLEGEALKSAASNTAKAIGNIIETVGNGVTDVVYKVLENRLKKQEARLNASAELQKRELQVFGETMKRATEIMADNVTGKIFETAYKSLDAVMAGGRQFYIKSIQDQLTMARMQTEIRKLNLDTASAITAQATQLAGGIAQALGPVGQIAGSMLSLAGNITKKQLALAAAQADWRLKLQEKENEVVEEFVNQVNEMSSAYKNMSKSVTEVFYNLTNKSFEYGRSLGFSGEQIHSYSDSVIRLNESLAQVGLTFEDYYKMQETYNDRNGRAGIISDNEALMMGGLALRTGADINDIASITGVMQQFNISIDNGSQMMYEISNTASKMGLSAKKFTKDVEQNLKLAEKYQFKGGVRGMMDMVLQAQKLRFNINELSGSMEKMLSGNIEDVMQTSARLNVLGGNAAIFSDPFSMMYNAAANPKAYMENLNRMIGGYGTFNKKTGETDFSINEVYRMRAIADATGQSAENVMNQARQKNKEAALRRQFGSYAGFDKYSDMIAQNAVYNRESGKWEIKVADRSKEGGFRTETLENALANPEMFDNIFPEDKQDTLIEYVRLIAERIAPQQAQEFENKRGIAKVMGSEGVAGSLYKMSDELVKEHRRNIDENIDKYVKGIIATSEATVRAQETMNKIAESDEIFDSYLTSLRVNQEQMDKFSEDIKDMDSVFGKLLETYNKGGLESLAKVVQTNFKAMNYNSDKVTKAAEDGTITKEEWGKLSRKEQNEFIKQNSLRGITKRQQRRKMNAGSIQFIDGKFYNPEGQYLRLEKNAVGGVESNSYWKTLSDSQRAKGIAQVWWQNFGSSAKVNDKHGNWEKLQAKQTSDVIISPKHGVFETAPQDTIVAWRPGGDIDRSESKKNSFGGNISGNATLTINGTLKLDSGRTSIDLMEILRNDPKALRELAKEVIVEGSRTVFGGKPLYAPNRYTFT